MTEPNNAIPKASRASVETTIKRALVGLALATVVIYLIVIGVSAFVFIESNANRNALCALRSDLHSRVATSEAFLKTSPNGVAGIPAATIEATIEGQKKTIKALGSLSC
jgi:hypothetical protein